MFEYMAAGLPVIASNFPYWREILERADCGLLVDPLDVGAIEAAMRWIVENPSEARSKGDRGRKLVMETLNWERQGAELLALYEEIGATSERDRGTRIQRGRNYVAAPSGDLE
jgi:glycosyltransferase involved in cell wall biosynthesis